MNLWYVTLLILFYVPMAFGSSLELVPGELNSGKIYVDCIVDQDPMACFFDSGSQKSYVSIKGFEGYQAIGIGGSTGAAGVISNFDKVNIVDFSVGPISRKNVVVGRVPMGNKKRVKLGIEYFNEQVIYFDFKNKEISNNLKPQLKSRLKSFGDFKGSPLITSNIKGLTLISLWDTGAGLTTIDNNVIQDYPNEFKFVKNIGAVDSTTNVTQMKLYKVSEVAISGHKFKDIYVLGLDFTSLRQNGLNEEIQFIIGYNIITKNNWYFDLKNKLWAMD